MTLAVALEDATTIQHQKAGGVSRLTKFFTRSENPDFPHASLAGFHPGRRSRAHFHSRDQFQIVIEGKGTLGRHDIAPFDVHFARAYTPYGPITSDALTGLTFFALRAHADPGAQFLPENRAQLQGTLGRRPWQITRRAIFASNAASPDTVLQAVPGLENSEGLAAYTISMKPHTRASAPDPALGDGQYVVITQGSLLYDGRELRAPALVFVFPTEDAFDIRTSAEGLQALVVNFPRAQPRLNLGPSAP